MVKSSQGLSSPLSHAVSCANRLRAALNRATGSSQISMEGFVAGVDAERGDGEVSRGEGNSLWWINAVANNDSAAVAAEKYPWRPRPHVDTRDKGSTSPQTLSAVAMGLFEDAPITADAPRIASAYDPGSKVRLWATPVEIVRGANGASVAFGGLSGPDSACSTATLNGLPISSLLEPPRAGGVSPRCTAPSRGDSDNSAESATSKVPVGACDCDQDSADRVAAPPAVIKTGPVS